MALMKNILVLNPAKDVDGAIRHAEGVAGCFLGLFRDLWSNTVGFPRQYHGSTPLTNGFRVRNVVKGEWLVRGFRQKTNLMPNHQCRAVPPVCKQDRNPRRGVFPVGLDTSGSHPSALFTLGQTDRPGQEIRLRAKVGGLDSDIANLPYGGYYDSDSTTRHDVIRQGRHGHGWIILALGIGFFCWGYTYALRGLYLLSRNWRDGLWCCLLACGMFGIGIIYLSVGPSMCWRAGGIETMRTKSP